jgi:hypothetical protein
MSIDNTNITTYSQSFLSVKSLDNALPDAVAGRVGDMFPGYELVETVDEFGEITITLGDVIPNATYRQRLLCNPYTARPSFNKSKDKTGLNRAERLLAQKPRVYNPDEFDFLGFPTEIEPSLIGQEYYVLPILRTRGIAESLDFARDKHEIAVGQPIVYPEGHAVIAVDLNTYLKVVVSDGL